VLLEVCLGEGGSAWLNSFRSSESSACSFREFVRAFLQTGMLVAFGFSQLLDPVSGACPVSRSRGSRISCHDSIVSTRELLPARKGAASLP
jgi:hypothetical protein